MKKLKVGAKIAGGYGLILLIIVLLGGTAIYSMTRVEMASADLADRHIPQVQISNQVGRHTLLAMHAAHNYTLTQDPAQLKEGEFQIRQARGVLAEIMMLAQGSQGLAPLRKLVSQAEESLASFNDTLKKTAVKTETMQSFQRSAQGAYDKLKSAGDQFVNLQKMSRLGQSQRKVSPEALAQRDVIIENASKIIKQATSIQLAYYRARSEGKLAIAQKATADFKLIKNMLELMAVLSSGDDEQRQLKTFQSAFSEYQKAFMGGIQCWRSLDKLNDQSRLQVQQALEVAQAIATDGREQAQIFASRAAGSMRMATLIMYGGLGVSLIVALLIGFAMYRGITRPVKAAQQSLDSMARGDFTFEITAKLKEQGDELGEMLSVVEVMADRLSLALGEVNNESEIVAEASGEISRGTQDLAERNQRQAEALEQTAAAVEQITSSVKQNAANAGLANQLAASTAQQAREGGESIQRTIQAMEAVTGASQKIEEIIAVVNEIAFQTNLLALNAAVEAARAGEAGRGFAVVASEVRNLAGRSAKAAKQIKDLITDSAGKVEQSNALVAENGVLFQKIIVNAQDVADTVNEITAASQEQATGVEEVNRAVIQIDDLVQQNAAMAEEAASTGEELAAAAEHMRIQVARFKIRQGDLPKPSRRDLPSLPEPDASQRALSEKNPAPKAIAGRRTPETKDNFFSSDDMDGFEEF